MCIDFIGLKKTRQGRGREEGEATNKEVIPSDLEPKRKQDSSYSYRQACASSKDSNAGGSTSTRLSLELFQNDTQRSGSKDEKSTKEAVTRGMDEQPVSSVDDDVSEELQLELGHKKMGSETLEKWFARSK
ncbi:unnamed protein product [Eruca vesicaria subsp. sativa]|uniref:PLAT domain-containing protein n=1 Tax=Eruca vesicaria subsp. sativa TaxID=29727 RepID=A0ABC8JQK8_ERUVS|nr:unnamed protein product [Eruca vesicaria subsp. sativa]